MLCRNKNSRRLPSVLSNMLFQRRLLPCLSKIQSTRLFSTLKVGNFVDGEERYGSGPVFQSRNPATNQVLADCYPPNKAEVAQAVESARSGFNEWSSMTGVQRGKVMRNAAQLIKKYADEIAVLETKDTGHPIFETEFAHVAACAEVLEYYADLAGSCLEGKHIELAGGSSASVLREPFGVTAGVVAWNYPFNMAVYKSAILLAAGNSVVLKPSEKSPVNTTRLAKIFMEAGAPKGALNVVVGAGDVGAMLVENPGINKVSFTGSTAVGKKILQMCSHDIKPATLELGGKSPLIVFEDADIDAAVLGAVIGNFFTAGEICTNSTRVFVHEKIYDEFLAKFVAKANALRVGCPLHRDTQMGALIDHGHADNVRKAILKGVEQGGEIVAGGVDLYNMTEKNFVNPDATCGGVALDPRGFVRPTIFSNVQDHMTIAKDEIFGPVACVLKFSDIEEVLTRANDSPYGLASGVYTSSLKTANYAARKLQTGVVWVNTYNIYSPEVPIGGYKQSGFGREFGREALEHATQTKSIYWEANPSANLEY